jgi:hypothetical protein
MCYEIKSLKNSWSNRHHLLSRHLEWCGMLCKSCQKLSREVETYLRKYVLGSADISYIIIHTKKQYNLWDLKRAGEVMDIMSAVISNDASRYFSSMISTSSMMLMFVVSKYVKDLTGTKTRIPTSRLNGNSEYRIELPGLKECCSRSHNEYLYQESPKDRCLWLSIL